MVAAGHVTADITQCFGRQYPMSPQIASHVIPPCGITKRYLHAVSPCCITMQYHHAVSPCDITMWYHHAVQPCDITMQYHQAVSPWSITKRYHHAVSPCRNLKSRVQCKTDNIAHCTLLGTNYTCFTWVTMAKYCGLIPIQVKGKEKKLFPPALLSFGWANFGIMKVLGRSQLVPIRSPGTSCWHSNQGL